MNQQRCRDCKFFKCILDFPQTGQCHRYPPKVVLLGAIQDRQLLKDVFVVVSDNNFCGEFESSYDELFI